MIFIKLKIKHIDNVVCTKKKNRLYIPVKNIHKKCNSVVINGVISQNRVYRFFQVLVECEDYPNYSTKS